LIEGSLECFLQGGPNGFGVNFGGLGIDDAGAAQDLIEGDVAFEFERLLEGLEMAAIGFGGSEVDGALVFDAQVQTNNDGEAASGDVGVDFVPDAGLEFEQCPRHREGDFRLLAVDRTEFHGNLPSVKRGRAPAVTCHAAHSFYLSS